MPLLLSVDSTGRFYVLTAFRDETGTRSCTASADVVKAIKNVFDGRLCNVSSTLDILVLGFYNLLSLKLLIC